MQRNYTNIKDIKNEKLETCHFRNKDEILSHDSVK